MITFTLDYVADLVELINSKLEVSGDFKDATSFELAIAALATLPITDDNDWLSVRPGRGDATRIFSRGSKGTRIIDAGIFVQQLEVM